MMNRNQLARRQIVGGMFAGLLGIGFGPGQASSSATPAARAWPAMSELGGEATYAYETKDGDQVVLTYDAQGRLIKHEVLWKRPGKIVVRTYDS